MKSSKADILLIGDTPGWAFDNIIDFVVNNLKKDYNFYYDFTVYNPRKQIVEQSDSAHLLKSNALNNDYRKAYSVYKIPVLRSLSYRSFKFFNKQGVFKRDADGKKRRVRKDNTYDCVVFLDYYMSIDGDFDHIKAKKVIKGIYTDGFPPKGIVLDDLSVASFVEKYLSESDALLTGSKSIVSIYRDSYSKPIYTANMAYDEKIFSPRKANRQNESKLILGWSGNPNRPFKGFYEIIEPVVEELKQEGFSIELKSQFSGTLNSLADFWNEVDLAVIASEADAGPSLFMEASLCGVPSISTRIGMPNEVLVEGENGIFIERDRLELKKAIIELYENPELLKKMSSQIRKDYIPKLGKSKQKENWLEMFENVLNEKNK